MNRTLMFGLFENKALLEESSSQWLFEAFAWSLDNFDANLFYSDTQLVLPTNQFFPGRVDSVDGMANLIFDQVKRYAGISHWPTRLADQSSCVILNAPQVEIRGALRGPDGIADESIKGERRLQIPYNPQQINNPEGMIAAFAHTLSHYMGQMAKTPPPGGVEYWPHVTELLAVYLGFGLMFANSAFTFRGGCGSCYNPNANRDAYLSEREATYAIAIFAVLKKLPNSAVSGHLKSHLRGFYKKAVKEIKQRSEDLEQLRKAGGAPLSPAKQLA
ncbi:MAG: hypothetical protein ABFS39_03910 [Pseudomonadota bacterium]